MRADRFGVASHSRESRADSVSSVFASGSEYRFAATAAGSLRSGSGSETPGVRSR